MAKMLIFKIALAVLATLATLWQIIRESRLQEGYTVEGQITYLEGKLTSLPLLTFSYTADGRRFHKSWTDTLDRNLTSKLWETAQRYEVGDTIPVWCSKTDPDACCIGERARPWDSIKAALAGLVEGLAQLFN